MLSKEQLDGVRKHLQDAVVNTLAKQINMPLKTEWTDSAFFKVDCMSIITLKTAEHVGAISIGFPEAVLLQIIENLLGEKFDSLSAENADASGELMNIIYSSARVHINALGFKFEPAIPATVVGKGLALAPAGIDKSYCLICRTQDQGQFRIMVSLKQVK